MQRAPMPEPTSNKEPEWSPQVLWLAAEEAAASGHPKILPVHLLIALCRFVDVTRNDLSAALQATQRRLRRELEALSVDPKRFRRRLRALVIKGTAGDAPEILRRELAQYAAEHGRPGGVVSAAACAQPTRAVIERAAALAGEGGDNDALHLLRALLIGDSGVPTAAPKPPPDGLPDRL
jgi:hypothetical protein